MRGLIRIGILLISVGLYACGHSAFDGDSPPNSSTGNGDLKSARFWVNDSLGDNHGPGSGSAIVQDATTITVNWEINATRPVTLVAVVSNTAQVSTPGNLLVGLYQTQCGAGGSAGIFECGFVDQFECGYNAMNNSISCNNPDGVTNAYFGARSLATFEQNKHLFLILQACNSQRKCINNVIPFQLL